MSVIFRYRTIFLQRASFDLQSYFGIPKCEIFCNMDPYVKEGVGLIGYLKENGQIKMLNGFEGKVSDQFHAVRCEQPSVVALLLLSVVFAIVLVACFGLSA